MTSARTVGRFIVIEHSMTGLAGHYWHYANSIAEAAEAKGYATVIVANRRFSASTPSRIKVVPWFTVDWFDTPNPSFLTKVKSWAKWLRSSFRRSYLLIVPYIAALILTFAARGAIALLFGYSAILGLVPGARPRLKRVTELIFRLDRLASGRSSIRPLARKVLKPIRRLILAIVLLSAIALVPVVLVLALLAGGKKKNIRPRGRFVSELDGIFKHLHVTSNDHVFLPTTGTSQLAELWSYLSASDVRADFHIVLRRDLLEPLSNLDVDRPLPDVLDAFARSGFFNNRVKFYVDTADLQKQYQAVRGLQCALLPIPPGHEPSSRARQDKSGVINVTYLGDARAEKGFQHLADVVWTTFVEIPEGVRFTIQANLNAPNADKAIDKARTALSRYPKNQVDLRTQALDKEEYSLLLAESDIVLLPYSKFDYRNRSSGILVEAIAAGKVVVIPSATSLESMSAGHAAVVYDQEEDIGRAVVKAAKNFAALSGKAKETAAAFRAFHSAENAFRIIEDRFTDEPARDWAVVILEEHSAKSSGSERVIIEQIRLLQELGLCVALWVANREHFLACKVDGSQLFNRLAIFGADKIAFLDFKPPLLPTSNRHMRPRPNVFDSLKYMEQFSLTPAMKAGLTANPPRLVVGNYIFSRPIIDQMRQFTAKNTRYICETTDLQSIQTAYYRHKFHRSPNTVDEEELAVEMAAADRFDRIIALTESEFRRMSARINPEKLVRLPFEISAPQGIEPALPRIEIDLLFVGSLHRPNVDGINWFYRNVFRPRLDGLKLHIVGTVCKAVAAELSADPNVILHGQVADLSQMYASARIVIAPIFDGAGMSIKTLEAFAYGKAFVGTPLSLRGLDNLPVKGCDDAASFAAEILSLSENTAKRNAIEDAVRKWVTQRANARREFFKSELLLTEREGTRAESSTKPGNWTNASTNADHDQ
jgi:hypothetical protein